MVMLQKRNYSQFCNGRRLWSLARGVERCLRETFFFCIFFSRFFSPVRRDKGDVQCPIRAGGYTPIFLSPSKGIRFYCNSNRK